MEWWGGGGVERGVVVQGIAPSLRSGRWVDDGVGLRAVLWRRAGQHLSVVRRCRAHVILWSVCGSRDS